MALLTPRVPTRTGVALSAVAAAGGGDTFASSGKEVLYVKNGGGGAITVTILMPVAVDGVSLAGKVVSVGAGAEMLIGPFPTGVYVDPNTGLVSITYSGVTTVTVAIISATPVG